MIFIKELVVHSCSLKNVFFCVFQNFTRLDVRGNLQAPIIIPLKRYKFCSVISLYFHSYDGFAFQNHADSTNEHDYTTLANYDGYPLAVGGRDIRKAEVYNTTTNAWTDIQDYPYHA